MIRKKHIQYEVFISVAFIVLIMFGVGGVAKSGEQDQGELYSSIGKRDPFRPPTASVLGREPASMNPLERFSIQQLALKAILKGLGKPRAMFEDPSGQTHVVSEGSKIGRERGTLSRILESEVIITERTVNYLGVESLYERVISLPKD